MPDNPMDDMFETIHEKVDAEVYKQLKQVRWEENMVKHVLRFYGVDHLAKDLKTLCADRTGEARLQFRWFMDAFPDFPVWLGAEKVPFSFDIRFKDIVAFKMKLNLFKYWHRVQEEAPSYWQQPVGFVFEALHSGQAEGAKWILHNSYRPALRLAARYLIENPVAHQPGIYVLDSFDVFLESLKWSPSNSR
jgi:hypothetical protein